MATAIKAFICPRLAGGPSFTRRVATPVRAGETRGCPTFRGLKRGASQPQKRQSLTLAVKYMYSSRNEAAQTGGDPRAPSILANCKANCRHPERRGSSIPTGGTATPGCAVAAKTYPDPTSPIRNLILQKDCRTTPPSPCTPSNCVNVLESYSCAMLKVKPHGMILLRKTTIPPGPFVLSEPREPKEPFYNVHDTISDGPFI